MKTTRDKTTDKTLLADLRLPFAALHPAPASWRSHFQSSMRRACATRGCIDRDGTSENILAFEPAARKVGVPPRALVVGRDGRAPGA